MNAIQYFQWGYTLLDKTTLEFVLLFDEENKINSCLFEDVEIKSSGKIFPLLMEYDSDEREEEKYIYSIYTQHGSDFNENDTIDEITFIGTVKLKGNTKIKEQKNSLYFYRTFDDMVVPPNSGINYLNYTTSVKVVSQNKCELNFKFNGSMVKPQFKHFYKNHKGVSFGGKIT